MEIGDKWECINAQGKIIINPQFTKALPFSHDLAAAYISPNSCGYINQQGKFVINPQFDVAARFHGDLAAVLIGNHCGYIGKDGKYVINPQFKRAYDFSDGVAVVEADNKKYGVINKKDQYIINSNV